MTTRPCGLRRAGNKFSRMSGISRCIALVVILNCSFVVQKMGMLGVSLCEPTDYASVSIECIHCYHCVLCSVERVGVWLNTFIFISLIGSINLREQKNNKKRTKLKKTHWLYAGPSCTICQFWLFAGQCKSIADQRKLYIFGSKVAICVRWVWLDRFKLRTTTRLRLGLGELVLLGLGIVRLLSCI